MKTKLTKILGVVLTVALISSMFVFAAPVASQAYTPHQWNVMTIPPAVAPFKILNGSDINDFAVGSDGTTVYAVDPLAASGFFLLKSTTGGSMWTPVTSLAPAAPPLFIGPATLVAVAPDDPLCVAVVDSQEAVWPLPAVPLVGDRVFYSRDGGATWADLLVPAAAAKVITDIQVSPARAPALLGRDIVVSTADPAGAAYGDIWLIGQTATWTNPGLTTGLYAVASTVYDYTSVAFEPNWLGGQSVVAVASTIAAVPGAGTYFQVLRTSPLAPAVVLNAPMAVAAIVMPTDIGSAAGIITSSLQLPSDFDSTTPPMIQGYVGINSGAGTSPDVYRQDLLNTRKLQIAAAIGIRSISFSGTLAGGTLFAGVAAGPPVGPQVWYSANPESALPSWSFSYKAPTGATNTVVQVAPDFASSGIVYAATTGPGPTDDESAFSKSSNGGVSYNQIGLIDTTITVLDDVMPAPDNSVIFLATSNAVGLNDSLWKSVTPPSGGSWERVRLRPTQGFIVRLSPDYLTDSTVYYCDFGGLDVQKSTNGGDIFAPRTAAVAPLQDFVVESQDVVYMASGASVYQSTNGAWYWGLPISSSVGAVYSIAMAPSYPEKPKAGNVLAGGTTGAVSLSTDAGSSFIPLLVAVPGGTNMTVCADQDFATNNLIYAGSATAGQGVYRYEFGVSTAWENIRPFVAGAAATGVVSESGTLYAGAWNVGVDLLPNTADDFSGAERCLYPMVPDVTAMIFDTMQTAAAAGGPAFRAVPSSLRVGGTATDSWLWAINVPGVALLAYQDIMCKTVIDVTVPATVPADPLTGYNAAFNITWNKPSNALAYSVGIYTDAGCTQLALSPNAAPVAPRVGCGPPAIADYVAPNPLAPSWNVGPGVISSGVTYYVGIFVTDQTPLDGIRSPFVATDMNVATFTIEAGAPIRVTGVGPTLLSPTCGDMNVPLRPGFSWLTMPGAEKYEFILATDSALTSTLAGTPVEVTSPDFQLDADLSYDTTYYYAVKVTAPTSSPQSICSFHTMEKPVEPTPPVVIPEAPAPITPTWIWAIVIIGAILVIAVIVLIVTTRRVP